MTIVLLSRKKISLCIASLAVSFLATAQAVTNVVAASFSEKVHAEVKVSQLVNGGYRPVADYKLSPVEPDFLFAIPMDSVSRYRMQINLMKKDGRHFKIEKVLMLLLSLNSDRSFTLKITPSKLDTVKRTGWELKPSVLKQSFALITGRMNGLNPNIPGMLTLQAVADGQMLQGNTYYTNSDGQFQIVSQVKKEGFYYISSPRWHSRVYLKGADRLELNFDNKTGASVFVKGAAENRILDQWQQLISPITNYGYNLSRLTDTVDLNTYIDTYKKLRPAMDAFPGNIDCTNARFMEAFNNAMLIDRDMAPIDLLYRFPRKTKGYAAAPKDFNEVPAFYQEFIQPNKFSNASLLQVGETRQFMDIYAKLNVALLPKEERATLSVAEKLGLMMNTISNDTLKSFFFNDQMGQIEVNNLSEFRERFEPYKKYAKAAPAKNTYQSIYGLFAGDTAFIGKSAWNFSLPDTSGKMVSMKDFKGKVVFVDVWATWCGPCKGQFPFLRAIEEEYHDNKDIVFVGISLDKEAATQKWKDMIVKENLGGIQLLDDFGKAFGRKYEIMAIPRFLLIDREGRWIEIRCPLPEAKENLKRYLDKALAEDGLTKK